MGTRPNITTVAAGSNYSATVFNDNMDAVADAIEACLGTSGTSGSGNSMNGDFDLNLNRILNVGDPATARDAANKQYVEAAILGATLNTSQQKPSIYTSSDFGADIAGLTQAIISAAGAKLVINQLISITQDYTLPSNVQVEVVLGGGFDVTSSYTLTVDSPFSAGLYTVFSGTGSVIFGGGSVVEVYPEWWGAVGDGVADDTVSCQAAINSTDQVLLTSSYLCDALTIGSNSVLRGISSMVSSLLVKTAGINLLTVTTLSSNVTIKDIAFIGSDTAADNNEKGVYAVTVTDLNITRCHFEKLAYSIKSDGCVRPAVTDCTFYDTSGDTTQGTAVMYGADTINGIISNNRFKQIHFHAIYLSSGTSHTSVTGNTIDGCGESCINNNSNYDDNPCEGNVISGNTITNGTKSAIYLLNNIQRNVISGNTIITCGDGSDGGIELEGASTIETQRPMYNIISSNIINGITGTSIQLSNASNNIITDNCITSGTGAGIIITTSGSGVGSYSDNNQVESNKVMGCSTYGINVSGVHRGTYLRDNIVSGSTIYDYYIFTDSTLNFMERLFKNVTAVTTSGTGEDDLIVGSLPGYYLGATGILRIKCHGVKAGTANTKTLKLYLHTTAILTWTLANTATEFDLDVTIQNTAANAQKLSWLLNDGGTLTAGTTTSAISTSATRVLKFTGTCADSGDSITQSLFTAERS